MSPMSYDILIFAAGVVTGGVIASALVWTLMLSGAQKIMDRIVHKGGFNYLGRHYSVEPDGRAR